MWCIETGGEAEWMMLCFQYLDNPRLRVVGYSEVIHPRGQPDSC